MAQNIGQAYFNSILINKSHRWGKYHLKLGPADVGQYPKTNTCESLLESSKQNFIECVEKLLKLEMYWV